MSLINEALKQAEMDRQGFCVQAQPMTESIPKAISEPMRSTAPPRRRRQLSIKAISAAVIFTLIAVALIVIQTAGDGPAAVQAETQQPTPQAKQVPSEVAQTKVEKSVEQIAATSAAPEQPAPVKAAGKKTITFTSIADMTPKYPARPASKRLESSSGRALHITGSGKSQSNLTVTGIFHGPGGSRALINGRMLRQGQQIDGATVVHIGTDSVDIDQGGQIITIGM